MNVSEEFFRLVRNKLKFGLFLFSKLPAAWIAGVRVRSISGKRAEVTVPYKWLSQNPFRSIYFACLSMAAEMSTGLLAMGHVYKRHPAVSMLVVKVESEYFKKATGKTVFVCEEGEDIRKAIEESVTTGEGKIIRIKSTGRNEAGETVAEFFITWSFKPKRKN